jgi:hypothetical protein
MLSIDTSVDSGFRRADRGGGRSGIQCGEHGSGIFVDDGEQRASWRFRGPPPSLPVLDSVQAEPKRVRESGLRHAKPISDRFHVNFLGHMCLESFLLPSKKSRNVVKTIHHLLELRFHAISRKPRKYYRPVSLARCALPSTGFSFSFFGKTGNLSLRQIYTTRAPPLSPIPLRATRTFRNPPVPRIRSPHSGSAATQCHDVRTLLLAKELVGNREVSRRLDNRLHKSLVLHWTLASSAERVLSR